MTAPLSDLQRRFAAWLADPQGAPARVGVYRNTTRANYRNALGATYPVVRELVGAPFFNAAVDAFVAAHPATGGDLNVYGAQLAEFLAAYPHARELPYLPDVARLEWALDEAQRAHEPRGSPQEVLAALAGEDAGTRAFTLDPSCRLVHSAYPVMRIWQVHQAGAEGEQRVDLAAGGDRLLVRREAGVPVIARLASGDYAWLATLALGHSLAAALEAALDADATFDLGAALGQHIADGTIMAVGPTTGPLVVAAGDIA